MKSVLVYIKHPLFVVDALTRQFASFIPDKLYLSILYRCRMGKWINWKNPQTFTEKIQWLKLYDRKPEYSIMVDKAAVKKYVANIIGEQYIIPTLGLWDKFDDIEFDKLPNQFVLKTTHGGGGSGVVVCTDKTNFSFEDARKKLEKSLHTDIYSNCREWPYKNVPRRIIAEKFIELPLKHDLTDFKIFCFNGNPKYIQVIQDRNTQETIDFFDINWVHQPFFGLTPTAIQAKKTIPKPTNLDDMLKIASILAKDIEFLRVDLYQTLEGIFFGELTFYPNTGMGTFTPNDWDSKLGDMLILHGLKSRT